MKSYSLDLRERVLRLVEQGNKRTDIIELFGVPLTFLYSSFIIGRDCG